MGHVAGRLDASRGTANCPAIVSALPGLTIVLIIFLITAFILKLLKMVLNQVEAGRLQLPGVHPETVGATRKLISVAVWLFALSAAPAVSSRCKLAGV